MKPSNESLNPKAQVVSYEGLEFVVDENPELKSSWEQRITVWSSALVSAALVAQGAAHSDSVVSMGLAILGGYIFAGMSHSDPRTEWPFVRALSHSHRG